MSATAINFGNLTGAVIASGLERREAFVLLSLLSWTRMSVGRCVRTLKEIGCRARYKEVATRRALIALSEQGLIDFRRLDRSRWDVRIAFERVLSLRSVDADQSSDSEKTSEPQPQPEQPAEEKPNPVLNAEFPILNADFSILSIGNGQYIPRAEDRFRQIKDRGERERADASARTPAPKEHLERERELNAERVEVRGEQLQADLETPPISKPEPRPSIVASTPIVEEPKPSTPEAPKPPIQIRQFARPAIRLWSDAKGAHLTPFETHEIQELVAEHGLERVKGAMRETARAAFSRPRLDWLIKRLSPKVDRRGERKARDLTPSRSQKIDPQTSPKPEPPTPSTLKIAPHPGLARLGLSPTHRSL